MTILKLTFFKKLNFASNPYHKILVSKKKTKQNKTNKTTTNKNKTKQNKKKTEKKKTINASF